MRFQNRADAGEQLGEFLSCCVREPALVLAIPLGGIPVASEIARILRAPLDVVLAGDVRLPPDDQVVGGVALGAPPVLARMMLLGLHASHRPIDVAVADARAQLGQIEARLGAGWPPPDLGTRTVIVVDEGLETGFRALAAVRALRMLGATRIIVAAPVCSPAAEGRLTLEGVEVIYLECPEDFTTTASHYEEFTPVGELSARACLAAPYMDGAEVASPSLA